VIATAKHNDALAWIDLLDLTGDQVDSAKVGREDDDLLASILAPQCP
jgi:hypothetical protein